MSVDLGDSGVGPVLRQSGIDAPLFHHWSVDRRIRDLISYKTYADLRAEASKTYINYLWWVIDPVLGMLVFYLVFGLLFQRDGEGYVAFLLTGLVVWNWYRQTIGHAGNTILNGKGLMNQVHVPKIVFPLVTLLTDLTKFALVFILLLVFLWISGHWPSQAYLALPLLLLVQLLLISALALLLAGLVPYLPDLRFLVDNLLQLQFFLSGIFFSAQDIPAKFQPWFYLNPMASLLDDYRAVLLHQTWPHWGRLGLVALFSILVLAMAIAWIQAHDRDYPRTLS